MTSSASLHCHLLPSTLSQPSAVYADVPWKLDGTQHARESRITYEGVGGARRDRQRSHLHEVSTRFALHASQRRLTSLTE